MSGHTPGVWRADGVDGIVWRIVADLPDGSGVDVANVEMGGAPGEAEANARLIAHAPDLYAVLRDVVTGCRDCNGTGTVDGGRCDECLSARGLLADIDGARP